MALICLDCPVIIECARYGLHAGVAGGFYAGVWLPWRNQTESQESADTKLIRSHSKRQLKVLTGERQPSKHRHTNGRAKPAAF